MGHARSSFQKRRLWSTGTVSECHPSQPERTGRQKTLGDLLRSQIGLEDREGVALGILTHGEPCHTGYTNPADEYLPAASLDEIRARVDSWDLDSDTNRLAGILTSSEPAVDATGVALTGAHAPIFLAALGRVIFPAYFEAPSKHFL